MQQVGKKKNSRFDTPVCISIHHRRYRLADPDGLSAKAAIDGVVQAGILEDDSTQEVKQVIHTQEKIPKTEKEETIISIEVC